MSTILGYQTDPLTLDFSATLLHQQPAPEGRVTVALDVTYFYPTGGGQPHDTGTLNGVRVLDVIKEEDGRVLHLLEAGISGPTVQGRIDAGRRRGHMQHHSAQHILSAALDAVLGLPTLSAKISADTPSTIDVPDADLSGADLARAEAAANAIIFEDRAIRIFFISDADVERLPFRRPPKVSGQIRVVEVADFDTSACGGTHCPTAGMIGSIKIIKTERRNQKLRLFFVAGEAALRWFQQVQQVAVEAANALSANLADVPTLVAQQSEQLKLAHKQLQQLQGELLALEVAALPAAAEPVGQARLACKRFDGLGGRELREMGRQLQADAGLVAVLAAVSEGKLSLVVSCGEASGVSARELLQRQLAPFGGRGGGDSRLAQGGGEISAAQASGLFDDTAQHVADLQA